MVLFFQLLGIAGYDGLLVAPLEVVTDKILQLIGQKYNTGCNKQVLLKEVIIAVSLFTNNIFL